MTYLHDREGHGQIFILGFAYILRRFPSHPKLFPSKRRNIYAATLMIADC